MASIDSLVYLLSGTGIDNSVKKISKLSSVINIATKNVHALGSGITDVSNDFMKLTSNVNKLNTNVSKLSKIKTATKNFNSFGKGIAQTSMNFMKLTTNVNKFNTNMQKSAKVIKTIDNIDKGAEKASKSVSSADSTSTESSSKSSKIGDIVKKVFSIDNIKSGMDNVDKYINASNGLAKINDGSQSQADLQNKVSSAANRSYTSYTDMAGAVTDMGDMKTFKSNDETVAFAEIMQKSLKYDGSDKKLTDVSGAMSDGAIDKEELNSIGGSGSIVESALSSYTGNSADQLQKMADQGLITADLLKNAMFASGDEINDKFSKQPKTFADIWTKITNSAMNALNPLMQLVSDILNSPAVQAGINTIVNALGLVSQFVSNLVGFITDNWSIILPILMAAGAILIYIGATALLGIIQSMAGVIASEIAAMAPFLIIIGIISAVIYSLQILGVSFEDVFGYIGGVVGIAIAGIWNLFLGLFDFILGIINFLVNPFIDFASFFGNLFTNPISSIIYLFQGMADSVLSIIETVASAMDKVFGTNMADTVSGWRAGIKEMADAAVEKYAPDENYQKVADNLDLSSDDFGLSRMDYTKAYDNGNNTGKALYGQIDGALSSLGKSDAGPDFSKFGTNDDGLGTAGNPLSVEGSGSNGSLNVNMDEEDMGYLRDMAERDYIANVATNTLAPNIAVSFGDVHETADVNQLYGRIQKILKEQIAIAPEGVY